MELKDVQHLMKAFEASDTRELKIDDGSFHLYLSKNQQAVSTTAASAATISPVEYPTQATTAAAQQIKAPLVGTVYLQAKPEQPAYVKVGDRVHKGDIVCIIEAMKMMTEVKSDQDGVISAVKVKNGELVEVDQPLFEVTED
ncbi:acetyl-CoA carboxylase biotin carboxyl carrier protein [Limosilactobacillus mucosae]